MHHLIYCTCPDQDTADQIARHLVGAKLAACVNILPGISSVYEWQGEIETAQEHLLLIKSRTDLYSAIETAIKAIHPYRVPEIIAVVIDKGSTDYLQWIDSCVSTR